MYGYLYQLPFLFIVLPIICFTQLHVLYFCSYTLFFYVRNDGFITSHCKGTINNQFINGHLRDNEQQISNLTLKSLLFYFAQFSVTIQQHYFVQTGYFLVFCLSADKIKKSRKNLDFTGLVLVFPPFVFSVQRRDRDSNPGYLAVQRFSRPPQSTTLPPLQNPSFKKCFPLKAVQRYESFLNLQTI